MVCFRVCCSVSFWILNWSKVSWRSEMVSPKSDNSSNIRLRLSTEYTREYLHNHLTIYLYGLIILLHWHIDTNTDITHICIFEIESNINSNIWMCYHPVRNVPFTSVCVVGGILIKALVSLPMPSCCTSLSSAKHYTT